MVIAKQIAQVRKSAESMDAAAPAVIGAASVGDVVRQGDLYLVCLADPPAGKSTSQRQLVPGTTQGSRHVAVGDCRIIVPNDRAQFAATVSQAVKGAEVPAELTGPAIVCRGDVTIEHPEHGHRTLPAGSVWGGVYQRQYAEEVQRVLD